MRRMRVLLPAIMMAVSLAGCTQPSPDQVPDVALPPDAYSLDGQPYELSGPNVQLSYGTKAGYPDTAYDGDESFTLDRLLSGSAIPAQPVIADFDGLEPAVRDLQDVTQRAIMVTAQRIRDGLPVNLLPSKLTMLYKPVEASPTDETINEEYGYLHNATFAAAYIERSPGVQQVVLVTAYGTSSGNASDTTEVPGSFTADKGSTSYFETYEPSLPGDNAIDRLRWKASYLKQDCQAERTLRGSYSSSCAVIARGDNQPFMGSDNVILVTTVQALEWRGYYQNNDEPVQTYVQLRYATSLSRDGGQPVEALSRSGIPYSAPPFDSPVSQIFNGIQENGGQLVGSNDIAAWPVFQITVP